MMLQHLDTVIAFAVVMLGVSLVITVGTQVVVSLLGLRGTNLWRSLTDLFETASPDREARRYAKEIARRVLRHPLISDSVFSRFYFQLDELPFVPGDAAGKIQWATCGIPFRPWVAGGLGGFLLWPMTLMVSKYLGFDEVCQFSDVVARYVPVLDLCGHPWRSGAILGAVFVGLLSRWRLATSISFEELVHALEKVSEPPHGTLPDPAQRAMLVIAGAAQSESRPKTRAVSTQMERLDDEILDPGDGGLAVALEKAVKQLPAIEEPRAQGLKAWFEHSMARASQRFTVQARVITALLSLVFVFAAHLDAIRMFETLSSDAQLRAQLAASADAMTKQAEQISSRQGAGLQATREGGRGVVPDVYRKAMAVVLQPRQAARAIVPPSPSKIQSARDGVPTALPASLGMTEASAQKEQTKGATPSKPKTPTQEKAAASSAPREDKATLEAKARAAKALEARPGFASREDAVSWLHATLDGDPAAENLTGSYEEEVNAELVSDADKLLDHSASMKRDLARSEFHLLPEEWPGWKPSKHELPGLLVAVALLSLGAPYWYNVLKNLASLRPLLTIKPEYRRWDRRA
jgi:hypothetical protein